MSRLYDDAYQINHTLPDGTVVPMTVQRVNYSPMTKWEAQPVGERTTPYRRWGRTRKEAVSRAAIAMQCAQQGTRVEWRDENGDMRHGVVAGTTGLANHALVFSRDDQHNITRTTLHTDSIIAAYAPQEVDA